MSKMKIASHEESMYPITIEDIGVERNERMNERKEEAVKDQESRLRQAAPSPRMYMYANCDDYQPSPAYKTARHARPMYVDHV